LKIDKLNIDKIDLPSSENITKKFKKFRRPKTKWGTATPKTSLNFHRKAGVSNVNKKIKFHRCLKYNNEFQELFQLKQNRVNKMYSSVIEAVRGR